jgi:hypothetical protein
MNDEEVRDRRVRRAFERFLERLRDKVGPVHAAALSLHWDEDTSVTLTGVGDADGNLEFLLDHGVNLMGMLLAPMPRAERAEMIESFRKLWLEPPDPEEEDEEEDPEDEHDAN